MTREALFTGKRQDKGSGELQAAQPQSIPQENYKISLCGNCYRHVKYQLTGNNQSMSIYQGHILLDHPDCHPRGQDWLGGREDTVDDIPHDHSKALDSVFHHSLVAGLRI